MRTASIALLTITLCLSVIAASAQQVQSKKRGVCAKVLSKQDVAALSAGVSWWYNWHYQTDQLHPGSKMGYVPMVWGNHPDSIKGLKEFLKGDYKPSAILAINEPNLRGQAFLTPEECAKSYLKIKAIADQNELPLIGPHMALGASEADSIKAYDPLQKKEVTYTFMVPYLKAFFHFLGDPNQAKAIAVHSYGNINELKWMIGMLQKDFPGKEIWVTEFAWWGAQNPQQEIDYMIQAVDLFERTPAVAKYAWFMAHLKDHPKMTLLYQESGKLSPLGKAYVSMPVHDPAVYYPVPGRIQAQSYTTMKGIEIRPTRDPEKSGFLEIDLFEPPDSIEYQLNVPQAGNYQVTARVSAKGKAELSFWQENKQLGLLTDQQDPGKKATYRALSGVIKLDAGKQVVRVKSKGISVKFNWFEIKKNN